MHELITTARIAGVSICIRGVRRQFPNGVVALNNLDLDVPAGQFIAILGPSGCGKSTLLRLVAGLDQPQSGTISVAAGVGDHLARRADVAYVFQDAHLLPWRSVLQNIALPLELMHIPRRERIECSRWAIQRVGLDDAANRYPSELSGGMKMRASLARAMVTEPKLLLLDEPFAALDEITRHKLDEQLRELWLAARMTVVFVTHSTSEAVFLAERAVVLSRRPGRIVADHQVELPTDRTSEIRGTTPFAHETRVLYEALERGGA